MTDYYLTPAQILLGKTMKTREYRKAAMRARLKEMILTERQIAWIGQVIVNNEPEV